MPGRQPASDQPDPSPGESRGSMMQFLHGLQDYLAARSELLGIESREAADYAKRQTKFGVIVAIAAFFGYTLLLVGMVICLGLGLAHFTPPSIQPLAWAASAGILGAIHLFIAMQCAKKLRRPPETPLFEVTRSELRKDREWIKEQQTKNESSN